MKKLLLYLETLVYLKPKQVLYQIIYRLYRPSLKNLSASAMPHQIKILPPIHKNRCYDGKEFDFLNIKDEFYSWCQTEHGMLWAYNLNYMDWLGQDNIGFEECEKWIDKFIADLPRNHIGQDAYPTALRAINWIKFFCKFPGCATKYRYDSLFSQVKLLEKKLEWHIMGNHLLEDAYALFISSLYFKDDELYQLATKLLKEQLEEQILPDGAHFEQSPMYHCILLDRLLDCVNFSSNSDDTDFTDYLKDVAKKMLGHLSSIIWEDGSIPLLNDSAYGIAPTSKQLFDYAIRLGLKWQPIPMKECGYRKMKSKWFEAIIDIGDVLASYQPGHSHADTFNYELRIDGKPFIVDTGISTYNKIDRRQYERSTKAHNTVVVDGKDSSRVWGGFRVGRRAKVEVEKESEKELVVKHNGFYRVIRRSFKIDNGIIVKEDLGHGHRGISYLHFAPNVHIKKVSDDIIESNMGQVTIDGAESVKLSEGKCSVNYNILSDNAVAEICFNSAMSYSIILS